MATVETNNSVTIMKYNNFIDNAIDISIRDKNEDEVMLLNKDVRFLHKVIGEWIEEEEDE